MMPIMIDMQQFKHIRKIIRIGMIARVVGFVFAIAGLIELVVAASRVSNWNLGWFFVFVAALIAICILLSKSLSGPDYPISNWILKRLMWATDPDILRPLADSVKWNDGYVTRGALKRWFNRLMVEVEDTDEGLASKKTSHQQILGDNYEK